MLDPNFMHTVVLICEHSQEGAFGLVVNRESDLQLEDLLPDQTVLSALQIPIYAGGPVGMDALQFLHRLPEEIPGGLEIFEGLYLGGELSDVAALAMIRPELVQQDVRFLLGYSGWGAGQLEGELASGSWIPAPAKLEAIFASDRRSAWRKVVRSAGDEMRGLEDLPPDVSWN